MRAAYADDSDESINKRANIDEFINSVDEYCRLNQGATLTDYLNQVTLSSDTDDMDESNYVTLATVHSVKGLEFKCVFLCGMEDGIMPTSRADNDEDELEEERRLMYVAITRARERLYLTRSKSRYLYGKREPTMRSRFLKELSSELELPKEARLRPNFGYSEDGYFSDDDPEAYGNSAFGGGRYAAKNSSYGGGYGGASYGSATGKIPRRNGARGTAADTAVRLTARRTETAAVRRPRPPARPRRNRRARLPTAAWGAARPSPRRAERICPPLRSASRCPTRNSARGRSWGCVARART